MSHIIRPNQISPHSIFWLKLKEQQEKPDEDVLIDGPDWNLAQQVFNRKFCPFFAPAKN